MNEKAVKNLEFDRIRELLAQEAFCSSAKERLLSLTPFTEQGELNEYLGLLVQAVKLSSASGRLPAYGYSEVSEYAVHAQKGGTVREAGLLKTASALRTAQQIRRYIFGEEDEPSPFPLLERMCEDLDPVSVLQKNISSAILSETEIADNASPQLYDIRRQIRKANSSVREKLNSVVTSAETGKLLQEKLVTRRNGRFVVPVKSENKNKIEGIVHDSSASGMTLYVEPAEVLELNNKLRILEAEESRETERILEEFSSQLRRHAESILCNERIIIDLDELFARAEYALKNEHSMPVYGSERHLKLRKARHPLIDRKRAVASDISAGESYTQIVITGPNTGGKTVALKTVGLCALMAQSALFVPCAEGSRFCMFDEIFVDIGDEQSIDQSLSTFSSHIVNISSIIDAMTDKSLILLDEVGAGTDPSEGAALAWAILKKIKSCGALSVATTHYNEIKHYALTNEGVINASMEFDAEKLEPTYVLHIGIPGKSNAFDISRRTGLSEEILQDALNLVRKEFAEFEDVIAQLEAKLKMTNEAYESAAADEERAAALLSKAEAESRRASELREKQISSAAVDAKKIINDARQTAREIISEAEKFRNDASESSINVRDSIASKSKAALDEANRLIPQHSVFSGDETGSGDGIKAGDEVFIPDLGLNAVVISLSPNDAMVQAGSIKTRIPLGKLRKTKKAENTGRAYFSNTKSRSVSSSLDIRGITSNEVKIELEKFIDDAVLAGLKILTVIHGKGSGILRKEAMRLLSENPLVESFRTGGLKEGGEGATIVYLE